MTHKECRDWLTALSQCLPRVKAAGLKRALEGWGRREPGGRWQAGLYSADLFSAVTLRRLDDGGGFPTRSWRWDLRRDAAVGAWTYRAEARGVLRVGDDGSRALLRARPVSADLLRDAQLSAVFGDFSALCPIRDLVTEWRQTGAGLEASECWSLRLGGGAAWPLFARASVADPFLPESARLAYLLRDLKVRELALEGGALGVFVSA